MCARARLEFSTSHPPPPRLFAGLWSSPQQWRICRGPVHPVILDFSDSDQKNFTLQAALNSPAFPRRQPFPDCYRLHLSVPTTVATIQGITKLFNVQVVLLAEDSVSEAPKVAVTLCGTVLCSRVYGTVLLLSVERF